jgi:uncharacterized protein
VVIAIHGVTRFNLVAAAVSLTLSAGALSPNLAALWTPELVIFGSGDSIRFPQPGQWISPSDGNKRIGIETMDTQLPPAAPTTYLPVRDARSFVAALDFAKHIGIDTRTETRFHQVFSE